VEGFTQCFWIEFNSMLRVLVLCVQDGGDKTASNLTLLVL
jgi:hypothetical protein